MREPYSVLRKMPISLSDFSVCRRHYHHSGGHTERQYEEPDIPPPLSTSFFEKVGLDEATTYWISLS